MARDSVVRIIVYRRSLQKNNFCYCVENISKAALTVESSKFVIHSFFRDILKFVRHDMLTGRKRSKRIVWGYMTSILFYSYYTFSEDEIEGIGVEPIILGEDGKK